ncbi:MAG: EF-Tu/IF-2/RF-3 family GTPase [Vicinamibacterales bacterium]
MRTASLQLLVANLDSSDYVGRIAIGRIFNGRVKIGDPVSVCKLDKSIQTTKVTKLYAFDGLKRVDITEAAAGDIVCLAGDRGHHHRRDDCEPREPEGDSADCDRRADGVDDLRREHVAALGARGAVRHVAPAEGPPRSRAARQRVDPDGTDGVAGADARSSVAASCSCRF